MMNKSSIQQVPNDTPSIFKIQPLDTHWETQDPFLMCAYHKDKYPHGNRKLGLDSSHLRGRNIGQDFTLKNGFRMYHGSIVPGFPFHPHRGFETVTIAVEGVIDHSDSRGGAGRFKDGDVQWMTAGKGIQHSEMFPLLNEDKDNPLELFQVWLNLPKKSKLVEPHFKMLWREHIPVVQAKDKNGKTTIVRVIAGTLNEVNALEPTPDSWAASPDNEVAIYTIKMEAGATWTLPSAKLKVHRNLYFYSGDTISIKEQTIIEKNQISLNPKVETTITNGHKDAFFLFLQGRPIEEPVAQYGPFVMNTEKEIREAISDYQKTQFGGWPWPMKEQVWEKTKGRFARYDDGTEEQR